MFDRTWIAIGAVLAAAAVGAGAIGTHFLRETLELPQRELETYDVAVRYQMVHAIGLIIVGVLLIGRRSRWLNAAAACFAAGILLFSGGLYAWLFTGMTTFVHVVPVGGMAWIVGWLLLAIGAISRREPEES
ncbi:MAG TPA: DUF423 domain-containing protein [Pirellulales bacterium]|jgi:uncharacterized membrane protein YgdD (TMEM256/DUF423 family)|nr:DUF423 domain-containing protein [Pirellulales bacterium]